MKPTRLKVTSTGNLCAMVILIGGIAHGAPARADGLSGVYVGGNFGRAQNEYHTAFIDDQYVNLAKSDGDTLKFTSSSVHRTDNTWWADAGYMIGPYVGVDASFFHLGELTHLAKGEVETEPLVAAATLTSHGPALSLVARLPLLESLDLEARLGDYYGRTTVVSISGVNSKYAQAKTTSTASSLLAGVGAAYTFARHWSIRLDYLRVNQAGNGNTVGKYNVNLGTAGVAFTF
jgi:hypothetical protein